MRPDLLAYVAQLSAQDQKNLSQKALKLGEEVGELAKAVLPYDNAHGTNHRFVTPAKILEEVADTVLVALSIAYSLGYSDEDIAQEMHRKADYWAELQAREAVYTDKTPYELHVTIETTPSAAEFQQACAGLGVKAVLLDLQSRSNSVLKDVMTSSVFYGTNREAYGELQRIVQGLQEAGFTVVRQKIETVPWHPAAPSRNSRSPQMPPNCYFECHIGVVLPNAASRDRLGVLARETDCHLSQNIFKRTAQGQEVVMMTYRTYEHLYEDVQETVASIATRLELDGFSLDKRIIEFSLFDSKLSHDTAWLAGPQG